jgi:hypothetical protein
MSAALLIPNERWYQLREPGVGRGGPSSGTRPAATSLSPRPRRAGSTSACRPDPPAGPRPRHGTSRVACRSGDVVDPGAGGPSGLFTKSSRSSARWSTRSADQCFRRRTGPGSPPWSPAARQAVAPRDGRCPGEQESPAGHWDRARHPPRTTSTARIAAGVRACRTCATPRSAHPPEVPGLGDQAEQLSTAPLQSRQVPARKLLRHACLQN